MAQSVVAFLKENNGNDLPDFAPVLKDVDKLLKSVAEYPKSVNLAQIDKANTLQRKLAETISPFSIKLHELLKEVDKKVRHIEKEQAKNKDLKILKSQLEALHKEVKATEYFFTHISWLQERFPEAQYEDVTGLCRLADMKDIQEQEYSLNPGRYVGVVIEEDGKTEEEFIEDMLSTNDELNNLNADAHKLEAVINHNIQQIAGEE